MPKLMSHQDIADVVALARGAALDHGLRGAQVGIAVIRHTFIRTDDTQRLLDHGAVDIGVAGGGGIQILQHALRGLGRLRCTGETEGIAAVGNLDAEVRLDAAQVFVQLAT